MGESRTCVGNADSERELTLAGRKFSCSRYRQGTTRVLWRFGRADRVCSRRDEGEVEFGGIGGITGVLAWDEVEWRFRGASVKTMK